MTQENELIEDSKESQNKRFVITQYELDVINEVRLDIHEIAQHNPQVRQTLRRLTPMLWEVTHKNRDVVP